MRILAQFSGGLDSLGAVIKSLEKYPLATFDLLHVQIKYNDTLSRWASQLQTAINSYNILKTLYPKAEFNLYTPSFSTEVLNKTMFKDVIYYQLFSGVIGTRNGGIYEYVLNGTTKSDCSNYNIDWPEFGDDVGKEYVGEIIYRSILKYTKSEKPTMWRPLVNLNKNEVMALIPKELVNSIWSCDSPILTDNICSPCETCLSCKEYRHYNIKLHPPVDIRRIKPILDLTQQQADLLVSLTGRMK